MVGPLKLNVGQVVEARVIKSLSSGAVLLAIQGKQVRAATQVPLPKNAVLSLMVSGKEGNVTFRLMDLQAPGSRPVNLASIRRALATNLWADVHRLVEGASAAFTQKAGISALLGKLARMTMDQPGAQGLKSVIQDSGLCWEHKLVQAFSGGRITQALVDELAAGDLKGMLLKLLTNSGSGNVSLKTLYSVLENIQLLNIHGSQQVQKLFVPLPLPLYDGTWGLAQILFHLPPHDRPFYEPLDHDSEQPCACAVTVIVELSRLGAVRCDLRLEDTTLYGKFLSDRSQTLETIESRLPSFTQAMANQGMRIRQFTCHLADTAVVKKDLISEIIPHEGSSVCFVA
jgi:hypothetical protein